MNPIFKIKGRAMTKERPSRPLMATVVCFYEGVIVVLAMAARSLDHWLRVVHPSHYQPTPFPQIAASELSYALAICAAILLWRMHHTASHLLAARAAISLGTYIFILASTAPSLPTQHARLVSPTMIHWITYVIGLVIVLLNIVIAVYVYNITSPRKRWQRVITVGS
jgi:hypothetical protein